MGFCLYKVGEYEEAMEALREALRLNPDHREAAALLNRLEYTARSREGQIDPLNLDALAHGPRIKKKPCPECGFEMVRSASRCRECGYVFPHYRLFKLAAVVLVVLGFLVAGRYWIQTTYSIPDKNPDASVDIPTLFELFKFAYYFAAGVASAFGSILILNWTDPKKKWNEEWVLELQASVLLIVSFTLINALHYYLITGGGFIAFIAKFFLMYLFFRRNFIYTIGLIILYLNFAKLFSLLFFLIFG